MHVFAAGPKANRKNKTKLTASEFVGRSFSDISPAGRKHRMWCTQIMKLSAKQK
jgi:hypothetical protein